MENNELNKSKSRNRLWALTLALLTCFSVMLTAFSFSSPKTNLVLAEEVEATATQSSPESITINVTTIPSTASKNFSVKLTSQNGSNTTAEEKIEDYISYEIASDYKSITVTCLDAFNGVAKIEITNVYNANAKTACYFRYKAEYKYENATVRFYNTETNDKYYCYGDGTDSGKGISNGGVGANMLRPGNEGVALLEFAGTYHFEALTRNDHRYTIGDYRNFGYSFEVEIDNEAFNSLREYIYSAWSSGAFDIITYNAISRNSDYLAINSEDESIYFRSSTGSGDFQFFKCFSYNRDVTGKTITEYYNLIAQWMIENPDVALFKIKHNDEYTSYVYNKYFEVDKVATDIETSLNNEYIFNQ